jgi:outer membrane scaffolding protein for murein synthesis (MipA/OmpV family)
VGLFNAMARLPHYRGSDEYAFYFVPVPYLIYRGRVVESDQTGLWGFFLRREHLEGAVSLFGNPPVYGDNEARAGMSELDSLLEAGPSVKWYPLGRQRPDTVFLVMPAARAVFSADPRHGLEADYRGLHGGVTATYSTDHLFGHLTLGFGLTAFVDFADAAYNRYLYGVEADEATDERPAYRPGGGYGGCGAAVSFTRELRPWLWASVYFNWQNCAGTAYEDSPLVRQKNNFVSGCALTWQIAESRQRVPRHRYWGRPRAGVE